MTHASSAVFLGLSLDHYRATFTATITGAGQQEGDCSYTSFAILVSVGRYSYTVSRRYSAFVALHDLLTKEGAVTESHLPSLPKSGRFTGRSRPQFTMMRFSKLNDYIQSLLSVDGARRSNEVASFFELNAAAQVLSQLPPALDEEALDQQVAALSEANARIQELQMLLLQREAELVSVRQALDDSLTAMHGSPSSPALSMSGRRRDPAQKSQRDAALSPGLKRALFTVDPSSDVVLPTWNHDYCSIGFSSRTSSPVLQSDATEADYGSESDESGGHVWYSGSPPCMAQKSIPAEVASASVFLRVWAGSRCCAALLDSGDLCTWGENTSGQLGHGADDTGDKAEPCIIRSLAVQRAISGRSISEVAFGAQHTVALLSDGSVMSWGGGPCGQLGLGNDTVFAHFPRFLSCDPCKSITAGGAHSAACTQKGVALVWGTLPGWLASKKSRKQSDVASMSCSWNPVSLMQPTGVTSVCACADACILVRRDGCLWSYGANDFGQCGMGDLDDRQTPTLINTIAGGFRVSQVVAGSYHFCAVTEQGTLLTWGAAEDGQLGNGIWGKGARQSIPMMVPLPDSCVKIAAGARHTLALLNNGSVVGFGANDGGQLGSGSLSLSTMSSQVTNAWHTSPVVDLAAGACSSLFLVYRRKSSLGLMRPGSSSGSSEKQYDGHIDKSKKKQENMERFWQEQLIPSLRLQDPNLRLSALSDRLSRGIPRRVATAWRAGIPPSIRTKLWFAAIGNALSVDEKVGMSSTPGTSVILSQLQKALQTSHANATLLKSLEVDSPRTFGSTGFFSETGSMHEELRELLSVALALRPDLGYVQGMTYIGAMLLMYAQKPEWAFIAFTNLIHSPPFLQFYSFDHDFTRSWFLLFWKLLKQVAPEIVESLRTLQLQPADFAYNWMMTMFCQYLPLKHACRAWDLYLLDGVVFLLRFGASIVKCVAPLAVAAGGEYEQWLRRLHSFPDTELDADSLFDVAENMRVSSEIETSILDLCGARGRLLGGKRKIIG